MSDSKRDGVAVGITEDGKVMLRLIEADGSNSDIALVMEPKAAAELGRLLTHTAGMVLPN